MSFYPGAKLTVGLLAGEAQDGGVLCVGGGFWPRAIRRDAAVELIEDGTVKSGMAATERHAESREEEAK